jgi:hypothetical protein
MEGDHGRDVLASAAVWVLAAFFHAVALTGDSDDVGVVEEAVQIAPAGGTSWGNLPQSSKGRLLVMMLERFS